MSSLEIAKKLGCSVSKINYWLNKLGIPKRTISDAIYEQSNKGIKTFQIDRAIIEDNFLLYGLGLGLYWGEGTKRNKNSVRLGNTDPDLIRHFISFLSVCFLCDQNRLKFGLQIFSDINPEESLDYWVKKLRVKRSQFYKPLVSQIIRKGTYLKKSKYGVVTIYYNNTRLRNYLNELIEKMRGMYYHQTRSFELNLPM